MSTLKEWMSELRKNPEFLALESEILKTEQHLDSLMQRLNDSFPPEGMRMWVVRGKDDHLSLVPSLVSIPESENE